MAQSGSTISNFKRSADLPLWVARDIGAHPKSLAIEKCISLGLLAALFFTALAHGATEPWSVALFEWIVIGLFLLWGIKAASDHCLEVTIPSVALPMAALFLLGLAQSIAFTASSGQRLSLSMDVEATRLTLALFLFVAIAFIIASNFLMSRERLFLLANALTGFGVVLAIFALIQHFTWNGRVYWLRQTSYTAFGPFVNHNQFAGYMAMLMPVPLALIVRSVHGQARLLFAFAAALMGAAVIMSNSRSGAISLAGSIVFMALLSIRSRAARVAPIAAVGLAIVATVVWLGASGIVERFGDTVDQFLTSGTPDVERAAIWHGTLNIFRAYPIAGAGLGAFETVYPTYGVSPPAFRVNYAHNDYLQLLAEGGVIAGVIAVWFLVLVVLGIRRGTRSRDPLIASLSLAAAGGIVAVLIQSLSDTDLQIPSNALLFLVLVAIVSTGTEASRGQRPRLQPESEL